MKDSVKWQRQKEKSKIKVTFLKEHGRYTVGVFKSAAVRRICPNLAMRTWIVWWFVDALIPTDGEHRREQMPCRNCKRKCGKWTRRSLNQVEQVSSPQKGGPETIEGPKNRVRWWQLIRGDSKRGQQMAVSSAFWCLIWSHSIWDFSTFWGQNTRMNRATAFSLTKRNGWAPGRIPDPRKCRRKTWPLFAQRWNWCGQVLYLKMKMLRLLLYSPKTSLKKYLIRSCDLLFIKFNQVHLFCFILLALVFQTCI